MWQWSLELAMDSKSELRERDARCMILAAVLTNPRVLKWRIKTGSLVLFTNKLEIDM